MSTTYQGRPSDLPLFDFLLGELKPKGKLLTPFNIISVPVMLVGAVLIAIRFIYGLGSVTNLNQEFPWGFWVSFDVITGVAFAGGAYLVTFAVYVMGKEKYHPIVRATVLNGFLAYLFYAIALTLDLGRPWNIVNPIIGNSFGYNSILFLVAWHFMLYMASEFIEFSPAIAEWLNLKKAQRVLTGLTLVTVIFGVTLSCLHQSGVGALFLLAKSKIHPLWYSEFIPVLFLVSSVASGASVIILEGSISHRVFRGQLGKDKHGSFDQIVLGLGRGAAVALFLYFFLKVMAFVHGHHWDYIFTGWGQWYMVEMLGFVVLPCALFAAAYKQQDVRLAQVAAVLTLIGIVLNRLNISLIAFNWNTDATYFPSVYEFIVTFSILFAEIWAFRWVVHRLPVLREGPDWSHKGSH
ncbi:MAG: NrfD/PsrC family molybdoenzyme membrane anchor subunit [Pseudomonadota bacterium]